MIDIVLVHPEIPPNTGNAIRLAANTGARLHLVQPLGFAMDDRQLKRAGLDYHELATVRVHASWRACRAAFAGRRLFAFAPDGRTLFSDVAYREGDVLVFGGESAGLPPGILGEFADENRLRLPMRAGNRSLNLSNAVAVAAFEAWRQLHYVGDRGAAR
jgi:tRNA (cytidine/uridine-2'-O-)-methyltransferase